MFGCWRRKGTNGVGSGVPSVPRSRSRCGEVVGNFKSVHRDGGFRHWRLCLSLPRFGESFLLPPSLRATSPPVRPHSANPRSSVHLLGSSEIHSTRADFSRDYHCAIRHAASRRRRHRKRAVKRCCDDSTVPKSLLTSSGGGG